MSDVPPDQAPPPAPPPAPTPAPRPPGPVIEYSMPAQKSFIPSPALIRNLGCLIKLIAGFTVLICLGYFALVALNPKARQWALQGSKPGPGGAPPSGKGPTPFKVVNQILAIPAQALGKTDDVVKANNARVGQLDGLIKEEEGKAKGGTSGHSRPVVDPFATPAATPGQAGGGTTAPADGSPAAVSSAAILALAEKNAPAAIHSEPPASNPASPAPRPSPQPAAPDSPDQLKLPGDIVITHASPAGAPRASAAFFYFIVKLNVSGITQGKPARALINNRLAYEGSEINRALGIVFAELDAANQLLVFRDQTGATVTRSY
jgi:hypothetical protein